MYLFKIAQVHLYTQNCSNRRIYLKLFNYLYLFIKLHKYYGMLIQDNSMQKSVNITLFSDYKTDFKPTISFIRLLFPALHYEKKHFTMRRN